MFRKLYSLVKKSQIHTFRDEELREWAEMTKYQPEKPNAYASALQSAFKSDEGAG